MKVLLNVNKLRFREGDGQLAPARQREILAGRLAGCNRVRRTGDSFQELEGVLALRGTGTSEGLIAPLPRHPTEPYRIKSVELRGAGCPSFETRMQAIKEAGYNTFLLKEEKGVTIYIDILTDSGTTAMSDLQWSAMMRGNEDYAGSRSYYPLEKAIR